MSSINPAAAAAREAARQASGEFGTQQHSAPDTQLQHGRSASWSPQQLEAASYEPPMKMAGLAPEEGFGTSFLAGARWVAERGEQPDDIAQLRRYAGQMSDDDFLDAYDRTLELADAANDTRFDWEAFEDVDLDLRAAHQRGGGQVADDYLPDAGIASEGYMGGQAFEGHLAKTTQYLSQAEVAKRIREDVKAAKQAGYLPANVKVSVRSDRGSMVSGFSVSAQIPDELSYRPGTLAWEEPDWHTAEAYGISPFNDQHSAFAAELRERIETVANRYASRDVNAQVDYFNTHHEARVSVETDDPAAANQRWHAAKERRSEYLQQLREQQGR